MISQEQTNRLVESTPERDPNIFGKLFMVKITFQIVREKMEYSYKNCWGNWLSIKGKK